VHEPQVDPEGARTADEEANRQASEPVYRCRNTISGSSFLSSTFSTRIVHPSHPSLSIVCNSVLSSSLCLSLSDTVGNPSAFRATRKVGVTCSAPLANVFWTREVCPSVRSHPGAFFLSVDRFRTQLRTRLRIALLNFSELRIASTHRAVVSQRRQLGGLTFEVII
jgi:hypothetical protein